METVYFKGDACHTSGTAPEVGAKAPDFHLTTPELKTVSLEDFKGKRIVLNIFPSLDTPVCATSVRRFNQEASDLKDTVVLCVSMDLPFAAGRFCTAEGLTGVIPASAFRDPGFAKNYGLMLIDGPLAGLLARAVLVIDTDGRIIYRDIVSEITDEPHYTEALDTLRQ